MNLKETISKLLPQKRTQKCPECGTSLSVHAKVCPECSHSSYKKAQRTPFFKTIKIQQGSCCATPLLIALILAILIYRVPLLRDFFLIIIIGFLLFVIFVVLYVTGLLYKIKRMFGL